MKNCVAQVGGCQVPGSELETWHGYPIRYLFPGSLILFLCLSSLIYWL